MSTYTIYVTATDQLTDEPLTIPLTFSAEGLTKSDAVTLAIESARENGATNPRVTRTVKH